MECSVGEFVDFEYVVVWMKNVDVEMFGLLVDVVGFECFYVFFDFLVSDFDFGDLFYRLIVVYYRLFLVLMSLNK